MSQNLKQIGLLLFVLMLLSCSSPKPAAAENDIKKTITVTETIHDTVFKIEKDSSAYNALLECQNGKVVLKDVTKAEPGRSLKSPKVRIENNHLSVDCEARAQELLAQWKSRQVKEVQINTITTIKKVNELTFWQKVQIWLGRILILVLVYYAGKQTAKFYRPY